MLFSLVRSELHIGWECLGSLTSGGTHEGPKIEVKQFSRCLDLEKTHLLKRIQCV